MKEKTETFPFSGFVEKVDSKASPEKDDEGLAPKWVLHIYKVDGVDYSSFEKFGVDAGDYVEGQAYKKGKYINIDSMEKADPKGKATLNIGKSSTVTSTISTSTVDAGDWKKNKDNFEARRQLMIVRQSSLKAAIEAANFIFIDKDLRAQAEKEKQTYLDIVIILRNEFTDWVMKDEE